MKKFPKKKPAFVPKPASLLLCCISLVGLFLKKITGMDDAWALKPKEHERKN
jgi:hypothetical protein